MRRAESNGLRRGVIASAVVHLFLIGASWTTTQRAGPVPMRVYAVNIVSPPPQAPGPPMAEPSLPSPIVEEPADAEEPEPEPEPEAPAPRPEPPRPTPPRPTPPTPAPQRPAPTPPAQPSRPSTGENPDPTSPGGESIDLQLRGLRCPSTAYCENIVSQLYRYFRPPAGSTGETEVFFSINRDGSVSGIRPIGSKGSAAFRLAAVEAVEQAGRNRAFGALPPAFQVDQLPVSFYFRPRR